MLPRSSRHLLVSGVISSVGLTVSLFIAGEAFADDVRVMDQAKFGALLSLFPALGLVAVATCVPDGQRLLVPPEPLYDTKLDGSIKEPSMPKIDEDISVHRCVQDDEEAQAYEEEDLEATGDVSAADNLCPHSLFRLELSYRLYPSPFSNVSNEYVARYARS